MNIFLFPHEYMLWVLIRSAKIKKIFTDTHSYLDLCIMNHKGAPVYKVLYPHVHTDYFKPHRSKNVFRLYGNSKCTYQPAKLRSLIRALVLAYIFNILYILNPLEQLMK